MAFLYFDLGNVLLAFSHRRRIQQLARAARVPPETIEQKLFAPAGGSLFWRLESGEIGVNEVFAVFEAMAQTETDVAAFQRAASNIFTPLGDTIALVERLAAAGNRLGVLSNTSPLDWGFVLVRFAFLNRLFETHVLSYEVRAMKPSPAIYEQAVARAGVEPGEVFFVDDRPDNVAGARAAGLDACLFTSAEALTSVLRDRGVPIACQQASE